VIEIESDNNEGGASTNVEESTNVDDVHENEHSAELVNATVTGTESHTQENQ
jgi:hypothetical protein